MLKAGTQKQSLDSLFVAGGTTDIIILKTTKNTIKCQYQTEQLTLNKHGVLCAETKLDSGKTWYSFCPSRIPEKQIMPALKAWMDSNTHNYMYAHKI